MHRDLKPSNILVTAEGGWPDRSCGGTDRTWASRTLVLPVAFGVNSHGDIVGFGVTATGEVHGFLANRGNGAFAGDRW